MDPFVLQILHFARDGRIVGIDRRHRNADNVRLAGILPEPGDLALGGAVVDFHDDAQARLFQFKLLGPFVHARAAASQYGE